MQKNKRYLEIGPGEDSVSGFETYNLGKGTRSDGSNPTHIGDARNLPFNNNTFDCVYSSHCIEHVHWYQVQNTIKEWARVVKSGGTLEIWTVNGLEVMKEIIRFEETGKTNNSLELSWRKELTKKSPFLWLVGKLYNYTADPNVDFDYHLHRALITPKFLKECFIQAGLTNVREMPIEENRLKNRHGWMNMGVCGTK